MAVVDQTGRLDFDGYSQKVLELKENTRRVLLQALSTHKRKWDRVEVQVPVVVDRTGLSRSTVFKHLNECVKRGLLESKYRGEYQVPEDWFT